jgi:hypothetical protein
MLAPLSLLTILQRSRRGSQSIVPVLDRLLSSPQQANFLCVLLHAFIFSLDVREHRRRLKQRLKRLGLVEKEMPSDGNCQFSSIADQLFGTWKEGRVVRRNAVQQIIAHRGSYAHFLPYNFEVYCTAMSENEWGDNVTIQAAADYYGVQINMITSLPEGILVRISPREFKSSRVLWLSYIGGTHFNSLYTRQGNATT